jgi:hypothetical protein
MITVGATILALFPLALEGVPLWKPLCYPRIDELTVATFITLLLVPVFYSICTRSQVDQMGNDTELIGDQWGRTNNNVTNAQETSDANKPPLSTPTETARE